MHTSFSLAKKLINSVIPAKAGMTVILNFSVCCDEKKMCESDSGEREDDTFGSPFQPARIFF
jgi:hypothetical protein